MIWVILGVIYFLPTIICMARRDKWARRVFHMNFFLGWTPIWFLLFWHATNPDASLTRRSSPKNEKKPGEYDGPDTIRF